MRGLLVTALSTGLGLCPLGALGQQGFPIQLQDSVDAQALAQQLLGPNVTIVPGSAVFIGSPDAVGTFSGAQGILPFASGVVLSTGALPATSNGTSATENLGRPGDAQLSQILGTATFDAAILEFEFVPTEAEVAIPYVFGSDEFPEFVGSEFNDGFVFLVNGTNVAVLPNGQLVSVNAVNGQQFFTDNTGGVVLVSLDGLAGLPPNELVAVAQVVPGQPNKIRIVIADASDAVVNSAVALAGLVLPIQSTTGQEGTAPILTPKINNQLLSAVSNHVASVVNALFGKQRRAGVPAPEARGGVIPVAGGHVHTGAAAGDGGFPYPWGVWASYQHVFTEDDFPTTAFDADTDQLTVGVDVSPWDNFVAGVALSYETTDADTAFNRGEQELDGFSVVPYVGAYLSGFFGVGYDVTADLSFGYSTVDIEQFRTNFFGQRVTSDVDAERWFGAANVTAGRAFGSWYVSGQAGVLFLREEQDAFVESDLTPGPENTINVGQFRVGGEVAYSTSAWGLGTLEPFVGAVYQNEFQRDDIEVAFGRRPANDDDDVLLSLGVRYHGSERVSATLRYDKVLAREDFDLDAISLLVRAEF